MAKNIVWILPKIFVQKNKGDILEKIFLSEISGLISINDTDSHPVFQDSEHHNILSISFDDVGNMCTSKKAVPITGNQAEKIVDFVQKIIQHQQKEKMVFLIHCTAGVSRSAAVGNYIRLLLNITAEDFLEKNPNIYPNKYVQKMLFHAHQKNIGTPICDDLPPSVWGSSNGDMKIF